MKCGMKSVLVLALALLLIGSIDGPARAQETTASFFSQGQAVYLPQDLEKCRKEASMDFQAQAISQALGSFLSPSQMASQYTVIQEKMLGNPERYVETYQVFTESSANGLFRITGQVTLNMDALRKDLEGTGWTLAPATASAAGPREIAAAGVSREAAPSVADTEANREGPRGMILSKQEILWIVAEKWEEEWVIPSDRHDPHGIFALSVLEEFQDYETSLRMPGPGTIAVDDRGNISSNQALSLARSLGIQNVVVGSLVLRQNQSQGAPRLEANLRMLHASSGKSQGEVRRDIAVSEGSKEEGAMELALLIVPQLERLIAAPAPSAGAGESPAIAGGPADWTLRIAAGQQYAHWAELEKALRERFKNMQVKRLEFGAEENLIHVSGLEGQSLAGIDGMRLPGGWQVKVMAFSAENRSLGLTFSDLRSNKQEPAQ